MATEPHLPFVSRDVRPTVGELTEALRPPRRFAEMSFDDYVPSAAFPSQAEAKERTVAFARSLVDASRSRAEARWRRRPQSVKGSGLYLDGGFGVGKTHLAVSLYYMAQVPKAYAAFADLTAYVGAIGFERALNELGQRRLLVIDEFELDDPGDTVLIAHLCQRLVEQGLSIAATSNTLPDRLGRGRFAADDFLREIQGLADSFEIVRMEGPDYRHRDLDLSEVEGVDEQLLNDLGTRGQLEVVSFDELLRVLRRQHPSRYRSLLGGVAGVGLRGVKTFGDQSDALRFVSFIDRIYEEEIAFIYAGVTLDDLFPEAFRRGGFSMKYGRALSRIAGMLSEFRTLGLDGHAEGDAESPQ
ncbi:MAG: cell division protein ZapE [Acidimicrobiales bacterium]